MIEVVTIADCHTNHLGEFVTFQDRIKGITSSNQNYFDAGNNLLLKENEVNLLVDKYSFDITDYLPQ